MRVRSSVRKVVTAVVALAALAAGCASTDEQPQARPKPSPSTSSAPAELTFSVYGPKPVLSAYSRIVDRFTRAHPDTRVDLRTYPTHTAAMAAYRAASAKGDPPDVFLMDHADLSTLVQDKSVQRLDDLLAERKVDFGDGYTRNGLEAFSADAALQCMPVDVSPMVVYYNPQLIELDEIAEPGHNPVTQSGWSFDEFVRAARQARSPGIRGLYVAPDLEQVAPFIWSGGGEVVDDTEEPTTLTLSDDASAAALERLLVLVRNKNLTLSLPAQRSESALKRFEEGKLGMILGYRSLTPRLRAHPHLIFDVMPMPKLSSRATSASMSGLCISAGSDQTARAADLLTSAISGRGAATLARTGYVMPANLDVVNQDAFLQSGTRPLHSDVFVRAGRDTRVLPTVPRWPVVSRGTSRALSQLFYEPVILPLDERLQAIDDASVPMFDPSKNPSPGATPSSGGTQGAGG